VRIYVNGQYAPANPSHDKLTDTIRTDKPLHLGQRAVSAQFRGRLDDVRLFNRALTAEESAKLAER